MDWSSCLPTYSHRSCSLSYLLLVYYRQLEKNNWVDWFVNLIHHFKNIDTTFTKKKPHIGPVLPTIQIGTLRHFRRIIQLFLEELVTPSYPSHNMTSCYISHFFTMPLILSIRLLNVIFGTIVRINMYIKVVMGHPCIYVSHFLV